MSYFQTMNTVLVQEVLRFNSLIGLIKESLLHLLEALQGLRVLSFSLDQVLESIGKNCIP
jgi:dynein heavy chain, axonemal